MPHHISIPLADGVRLHAESHGRPDAPVTVLLLHGWTLDGRTWHRQISALAETLGETVRIVTYDARGHGRSGTIPRHSATLAHLGDDLAQVLAQLAPAGPVLLGGHSMGGMTIMEYAHRHPADFAARVGGLVFVATTAEGHTHTRYGLPTALGQLIRLMEITGAGVLARCGQWRPPRPLLHALRPSLRWLLFGEVCDPEDIRLTIAASARATMTSIGGFRASIGAQQRLATLAALGQLPAAALVGDRDRLTPPVCAESIAGALPGTELTICPGAGHMLMLERAAEVNSALVAVARQITATHVPTGAAPVRVPVSAVNAVSDMVDPAPVAAGTTAPAGAVRPTQVPGQSRRPGRFIVGAPAPAALPRSVHDLTRSDPGGPVKI